MSENSVKLLLNIKYIVIVGNIGVGKIIFLEKLGYYFGWDVYYEFVNDNFYLSDFYEDMQWWFFNLQVFFLNNCYQQVLKILFGDCIVVQDCIIYEDVYIFVFNLYDMGLMFIWDF